MPNTTEPTGADLSDTPPVQRRRRRGLRPMTWVVLVTLALTTVVLDGVNRRLVAEQEHRLLEERSQEVAIFLESALGEIELTFPFLAATLQLSGDPIGTFDQVARGVVRGPVAGAGLVQVDDAGTPTVLASAGAGPAPGQPIPAEWAAVVQRAAVEHALVSGVLPSPEGKTHIGFAYGQEGSPFLLFEELHFVPTEVIEREDGDAFSDIEGVVYAGRRPNLDHVVLTSTGDAMLTGDTVEQPIEVGADEWLLVAKSNGSLVSGFATSARVGVLIGGVLVSVLAAVVVEVLSRRRSYALQLVEERTIELRSALQAQAQLEQGQRQAREAAEEANRSKSEFLSRMSHELRTPLNAVLGFAQLLELDDLPGDQQEAVDQILKGGRHLLELINEVLDISRIESGSLSISSEPVLVGEVVQDVVDLMRPLAQQHGVELRAPALDGGLTYVLADAQRLRQVLLNLVANAVKYNRPDGTVTVGCSPADGDRNGGRLRLFVQDTGAGIAEADLELAFLPFERLGAEGSGIEGSGVGLALSRRLVEAMGGTLSAVSELGGGSTFTVELPAADGPDHQLDDELATGTRAIDEGAGRHGVLYIEDNLSNVRLIERVLAWRRNIDLLTAGNGSLGIDLARQHRPGLILLDLHLPDIDGAEVLRRLAADPATASIPVLMISADATPRQIDRLLAEGAAGYLTKPLDVRTLLEQIDRALAPVEFR